MHSYLLIRILREKKMHLYPLIRILREKEKQKKCIRIR